MRCHDCQAALVGPSHGFTASCKGCAARAISRGPNYRAALDSGRQGAMYRDELHKLGVTHEDVKAAAAADAMRIEKAGA
jgi:hypothetical protein